MLNCHISVSDQEMSIFDCPKWVKDKRFSGRLRHCLQRIGTAFKREDIPFHPAYVFCLTDEQFMKVRNLGKGTLREIHHLIDGSNTSWDTGQP
jgi:hypothetical protein